MAWALEAGLAGSRIPGIGLAFWPGDGGHPVSTWDSVRLQLQDLPPLGVDVLAFTNGASLAVLWLPAEREPDVQPGGLALRAASILARIRRSSGMCRSSRICSACSHA